MPVLMLIRCITVSIQRKTISLVRQKFQLHADLQKDKSHKIISAKIHMSIKVSFDLKV